MYCGYVTTIRQIRKHGNADRLQVATIFGNDTIVDLSYHEGQRIVYFPVDGQLSEEFCADNNLVRKLDENGNNVGGYLDPNKRNITAIKLRGEKSDGLVLPIEVLAKYTDIEKLADGTQITEIDGHEICRKYIPRSSTPIQHGPHNKAKSAKPESKEKFPFFVEHIDTEQLAYNEKAFKPGDTCYITLKMHGCFHYSTMVNLWGQKKAINICKVKPGDVVIGYKDGRYVPSKVIETYKNGTTDEWREIRFKSEGFGGESNRKIICTPDHLFYDHDSKSYVRADSLASGRTIYLAKSTPIFSKEIKQLLIGLYLGDGCLTVRTHAAKIEFSHKIVHEEYNKYIESLLPGLVMTDDKIYTSGYGTQMLRSKTIECAAIKQLFDSVLSHDGVHKLDEKIIDEFGPISLAFLFMDDGSLSHNSSQLDRANIAICDYDDHDAEIICKCIEKTGVTPVLFKDNRGYNRIRINKDDSDKLFNIVSPYIPTIMRYKLPEKYRDGAFVTEPFKYELGYENIPITILSNNPYNAKRCGKYDLHTETDNYVVNGVLVHNSSGRTANAVCVQKKKQNIFQRVFHLNPGETRTYRMVSGTRRTTLRNFEPSGYYNDNDFRKKWHDFFSERLPKGVEVYYELVGWVNESTPIMGRCKNSLIKDKEFSKQYGDETVFNYGCAPGECDCYVYRMTMTNDDGFCVEIPWEETKLLCEKMGVKHVPEFEKFTYTTWEDLMERVEKYYDGPDPIGKTHVREGVVVRLADREVFEAYKHKNFSFKVLSHVILDNTNPDEVSTDMLSEM